MIARRLRDIVLIASLAAAFPSALGGQARPQAPATAEFKDFDALLAALPAAAAPVLDQARAHWLLALPLACLDQLQPRPTIRPYFWDATFKPVDGYDKNRAFYGCADWHSAVNATWTIVAALKRFPDLAEGQLVREKLNDHLGKQNFEGELAFFRDGTTFERPYGQAWLLKLQAELVTWDDPQAEQWAVNVSPLAKFLSEKLVDYLRDLDQITRSGGQTNTALSLGLMLDAIDVSHDYPLKAAVMDTARKFYAKDVDCATESEPAAGDIASPCLSEAALMSRVLDQPAFVAWLDKFLPVAYSAKFKPLTTMTINLAAAPRAGQPGRGGVAGAAGGGANAAAGAAPPADATAAANGRATGRGAGGSARANPVGLAFARAEAFARIAAALPAGDKRLVIFRRLSAIHAEKGAQALSDPAVLDAPWLGAVALASMRVGK